MLAVRARALLDGRFAPSVDDVLELAEPVLKHRMALTFAARAEGETIPNVIRRLEGAHRIIAMAESNGERHRDRSRTGKRRSVRRKLAAAMPRLILEARRVASTVIHGLHGRRRAGPGENFWQYPPLHVGRAARRMSTGDARRATIISMCANANGRPRTRSGSGPTVRHR